MRKLLITGAHSYVGDTVADYLRDTWEVATLDMHGKSWKQADFSGYDAIFHVAGIVHLTGEKAKQAESLYHQVNTTLAIETAKKAKAEGVGWRLPLWRVRWDILRGMNDEESRPLG